MILESEYLNEPAVIISWFSNEEANVRKREVDDTSQDLVSLSISLDIEFLAQYEWGLGNWRYGDGS